MIVGGPTDLPHVGWSLEIRTVPEGQCTYSCVYCCLGGTERPRSRRRTYRTTDDVIDAVRRRLDRWDGAVRWPEYLTLMHGGEPTLDAHLGVAIERLEEVGIPVAVMTNGSLLWKREVRADLLGADLVVVKVDAVQPPAWRRTNRPAGQACLGRILEGLHAFALEYPGRLETESVLVPGLNDGPSQVEDLRAFLEGLAPARSHLVVRAGVLSS